MLARAVLLVAATRVALHLLPYRRVEQALAPERVPPRPTAGRGADPRIQRRVLWAVDAAARRLLPRKPCLTQALVARWLLARHGIPSTMRIGVAYDARRRLQAHAWLEQEGRVILGGADSPLKYTPLAPLQEATA